MELSQALQDRINVQIKHELYSAYLYLSMAAHCETLNFPGFAHWMRKQSQEEVEHAMKFYGYVHERGGRVVLQALEQPPAEFGSPLELFKAVLEHERKVTALITELYELTLAQKDYAAQIELQWFVKEQVEEERHASDIVAQLEMIGGQANGLIMLDHQLGGR